MKYIKIFVALLIFISFTPFTSSASASEVDSVQKLWDGINGQLIDAKTNSFNEKIAIVKDMESRLLLDNNWAYFSIGKTNVGTTYEPTKQWSISFSTEIDASTVTPSSIYVTNKAGQKAAVTTKVDGSKIYLSAPASGYVSGETYTLHITDALKAKSGSKLKSGITKEFTIR